jgi:hypothetical protein
MMQDDLIKELLDDPFRFAQSEKIADLLSAYYDGLSLDTLRPLMRHDHPEVQAAALSIASELGVKAAPLLDDAIHVLSMESTIPWSRFHALEVILISSVHRRCEAFAYVAEALADSHKGIRELTMLLVGNSSQRQIEQARQVLASRGDVHPLGLSLLLEADRGDISKLSSFIKGADPLLRKYAVIAAYRSHKRNPTGVAFAEVVAAASDVQDPEVQHFMQRPDMASDRS